MSSTKTLRVLPYNKPYIKNVLVWNSTEANEITSEANDITTEANDIPLCPRLVPPPPACQHEYCGHTPIFILEGLDVGIVSFCPL
jgi:hypothetical protein